MSNNSAPKLTQTHTAILSSVQATQTQVLTALLPLQPLVQACPSHANRIKAELDVSLHSTADRILKAISTLSKANLNAALRRDSLGNSMTAVALHTLTCGPTSSSPIAMSTVSKRKKSLRANDESGHRRKRASLHPDGETKINQHACLTESTNLLGGIPYRLPSRLPLSDITATPILNRRADNPHSRTSTQSSIVKLTRAVGANIVEREKRGAADLSLGVTGTTEKLLDMVSSKPETPVGSKVMGIANSVPPTEPDSLPAATLTPLLGPVSPAKKRKTRGVASKAKNAVNAADTPAKVMVRTSMVSRSDTD